LKEGLVVMEVVAMLGTTSRKSTTCAQPAGREMGGWLEKRDSVATIYMHKQVLRQSYIKPAFACSSKS
jgi:hypothetical protein